MGFGEETSSRSGFGAAFGTPVQAGKGISSASNRFSFQRSAFGIGTSNDVHDNEHGNNKLNPEKTNAVTTTNFGLERMGERRFGDSVTTKNERALSGTTLKAEEKQQIDQSQTTKPTNGFGHSTTGFGFGIASVGSQFKNVDDKKQVSGGFGFVASGEFTATGNNEEHKTIDGNTLKGTGSFATKDSEHFGSANGFGFNRSNHSQTSTGFGGTGRFEQKFEPLANSTTEMSAAYKPFGNDRRAGFNNVSSLGDNGRFSENGSNGFGFSGSDNNAQNNTNTRAKRPGFFENSEKTTDENRFSEQPDGMEHRFTGLKPTFIPRRLNSEQLYQRRINEGIQLHQMFSSNVQVTSEGKRFDLKPVLTFDDMNLPRQLLDNIVKSGYKTPFPIQRYVVPIIMAKRDLMACAQTGSGKTTAYLLPIIHSLLLENDFGPRGKAAHPKCIIIAPTRELAEQIYNEGCKFANETLVTVERLYGGMELAHSLQLMRENPTILVGTTGRMKHFIEMQAIMLDSLRYVVIDEADRMLNDEGFADTIRKMLATGPPKQERITLMFSATFPEIVQRLAQEHLNRDFMMLAIDKIGSANRCITQDFIEVTDSKKKDRLLELLKIDVKNYQLLDDTMYQKKTLVFVNRKTFADHLGVLLCESGLNAVTIHGDRDQEQRDQVITEFRCGTTPVMVATAVAERGLDIVGVDHVINYDLPQTIEEYVHRIGRTGRVGNPGRATSFFDANEKTDVYLASVLINILKDAQQVIPTYLLDASESGQTFETRFLRTNTRGPPCEEEW